MRDIVVTPRLTIPAGELAIAFARSGGPGGQNVNKVSSKVDLRWNPTTSEALTADDRTWLLARLAKRLTTEGTLIVTSTATRDQLEEPRRRGEQARADRAHRARAAEDAPRDEALARVEAPPCRGQAAPLSDQENRRGDD